MTSNYNNALSNNELGERTSFLKLIEDFSIVIPVIQRDYAQGRETEKVTELRNNFVSDLMSFLEDPEKKSHDLDAIYGSVQDEQFVPLDGQQRLTTLFLLHLYIAGMNSEDSFKSFQASLKGRFSYMTRRSSTMFCEKLIDNNVFEEYKALRGKAIEEIAAAKKENPREKPKTTVPTISNVIKNQGWFFDVWLQDPTVSGMLVMLDSIDDGFRKNSQLSITSSYSRLFEDKEWPRPITFLMLPLNGYSKKDDLYIKMNARGVHLTNFENFKAKFEDFVGEVYSSKKEELKRKFDVDWAEYLWRFHDKKDNTDLIMERIIRFVIGCSFRKGKQDTVVSDTMDYLLEQNGKTMRFTFSRYCELDVFHKHGYAVEKAQEDSEKKIIETLIDFFDIICSNDHSPLALTSLEYGWTNISKTAYELFLLGEPSQYSSRLRLYAYLKYICTHKQGVDENDLGQWMRIIRNLDEATPINNSYDFHRACSSVDSILVQISSSNVLDWLSHQNNTIKIGWFRGYQFIEETIKAKLLLWDNGDKMKKEEMSLLIHRCESNNYMKGQLGFLLHFSGIWETGIGMNITTLFPAQFSDFYNAVKTYADKAISIFECFNKEENNPVIDECLLERALLAKGFYLKKATSGRRNFCNDPWHRDFSWKSMLIFDPSDNKNKLSLKFFKEVLDEVIPTNVVGSLREIIKNAKDDNSFISVLRNNPKLIKYCSQGFVTLYGEYIIGANPQYPSVVLLGESRMSHHHSELYTRDLYETQLSAHPFIQYQEVRREGDDNALYFTFIENGHKYRYNIYHWDYKWSSKVTNDDSLDEMEVPQEIEEKFKTLDSTKGGLALLKGAIGIEGANICGYVPPETVDEIDSKAVTE